MIHSPTKAENKVMVAIKEVNENELPENGKTPSVCLHVSSVIHSVSNCHFPSNYLFMFMEGFLFNAATCASSQSPSNCHFPSVYLFMFIEGFLFTAATCAASQSPDQFSGGVRAAGKKGWEAGLGQAKTFYTSNKHQSYLFQADSCQTEIVK